MTESAGSGFPRREPAVGASRWGGSFGPKAGCVYHSRAGARKGGAAAPVIAHARPRYGHGLVGALIFWVVCGLHGSSRKGTGLFVVFSAGRGIPEAGAPPPGRAFRLFSRGGKAKRFGILQSSNPIIQQSKPAKPAKPTKPGRLPQEELPDTERSAGQWKRRFRRLPSASRAFGR